MNQQSRVSAFLHQIRILPLFALRLSRGKRLLIVTLCYGLGETGLWFLFPLVHNGATMFLPIVSACWLFRYRGLLVSLVLNGVAFQLTYLFLLRGMLPDQAFVEGGIIGFGTSLGLGLVVCWLRAAVDHVHAVRQQALAEEQKRRQVLDPEHQIMLADEYQYKPNEGSDQSPLSVLGGSLELPKERQEHLDLMTRVDVLTGVTPLDQQETSLGRQIGQYRLVRKLGSGGFGTVYLAEHRHEHTQVALKTLQMTRGEGLKDFLNEACTMWLRHPHIVPLLDFGINDDDLPFLVMEYAPQGTLRDRHPKGERIPLFTIVSYVDQLATALQYAHDQRVIHRDVKPANILVRADGTLMMSDFGIAKLLEQNAVVTSVQTQVGTPAYMAPEQYRGYPCFASDQYALAVVVYEWICGVRPFQGPPIGLAFQHMNTPPQRLRDHLPELSEAVERVIFKALAKNPAERFERIEEFAHALRQAIQASPEQVPRLACDPQSEPLGRDTESVHLEPGTKTTDGLGSQTSSSPIVRHAALSPQRAQIPIRVQANCGNAIHCPICFKICYH
jgi:serine/threonine protein kinase